MNEEHNRQRPGNPGQHSGPQRRDASVPADDRVIGQAFKWSLIAILAGLSLAGGSWLLWRHEAAPIPVEEAVPVQLQSLPEAVDQSPPVVLFTDTTRAAGIDFVHVSGAYGERLLPETMGSGAAFLDYNDDGLQDLLFVNSSAWPWRDGEPPASPGLFRNRGDGGFDNISAQTGLDQLNFYGTGVAVADLNGDGYPEVFIAAVGPNRLLLNDQGQGFTDVTEQAGVAGADDTWSSSAAFLDYDRDGDLDLFVCNYVVWSRQIDLGVDYRLTGIGRAFGPPSNYAGTHSYLYRNNSDGSFTDVSAAAGIQVDNPATGLPVGKALGLLPVDLDNDGWVDIVVANDTVQNFLFRNLGDGTFEEAGLNSGFAFDNSGAATGAMGIDAARYNNGDELAIAVGNFANEMSSFYVARGGQSLFADEAIVSGIGPDSREALSFGLFFFDYDLDGRLDLLQTNGHVEDEINVVQPSQHYEQPTQLFWNCGPDCSRNFVHVPAGETGDLGTPVVGRGATYGDYDQDGDLDVVITQVNRPPLLLRNDQALDHHWLRVTVEGMGANRDAIGAELALTAEAQTQRRTIMPTRSYLAQAELPVTFGLGNSMSVDRLEVTWPDGAKRVLRDISVDQALTIAHPGAGPDPYTGELPPGLIPANLERLDPAVAEAIRRQSDLIEGGASDLETLGALCLIFEANTLWDSARECLTIVAGRAPGNYLWKFHLAIATRESGQVEEALSLMQKLAIQFPDFAPLQQRLGEALLETGEVSRAQSAFRRVIELEPGAAEGYAGLGDTLLREQRYAAAVEALEQAVRSDPQYRASHYLLGMAYRGVGRMEEAARELAIGVNAQPRYLPDPLSGRVNGYSVSSTARIGQGMALLSAGRPAEAAAVLEQALAFEPDDHTLLNNLAIAYLRQGQLDRAYQTLQRALEVDDAKFSTYLNLSAWALRKRQPEQALAYADSAITRGPDLYQTHLARARILVQMGRLEEAAGSLQTAALLNSRAPQTFTMLGELLTRLQRYKQAEENFRDALSVGPDFLPAYLGLTRVYLDQGRLDEAAKALQQAGQIAPGHPALKVLSEELETRQ